MPIQTGKAIKIMLIEDDTFLSSMYAEKLSSENFLVVTAMDGQEALEKIKREIPDVVLLDIMIPKVNGFEVLKRIKTDAATAAIPVILLTNLSQENEVKQGLDLGASDYLVKAHFTPTEVIGKIKKVLGGT